MSPRSPKPKPSTKRIRRAAKSVRSGFRRYPRAIIDSLKVQAELDHDHDLPDLIQAVYPHDLAVVWLGHASVLSQVGNHSVLVDPVLSSRIGMRVGSRTIGLPRLTPPPVPASVLRGVDIVLITHAHFDHLDRMTLEQLTHPDTTVVVPVGCRKLIPSGFGNVIELPQGEEWPIQDLNVLSIEPAHWGARRVVDRNRGVNAYVVEGEGQRVLFAGDTAHTKVFDHLEHIDLAVLGIGAYDPWEHMHATPEQAWAMFERIDANYLLPVHHSTFELSDEPLDEPMRRLQQAAGDRFSACVIQPVEGELVILNPGSDAGVAPDTPGK